MNQRKIILILLIPVAILGFFMFKWLLGGPMPQSSHPLRMALPYRNGIKASNLDPAKVDSITKAHLIRMIYARLVEYSVDGQIQGSLAESFRIEGRKAIFKIRDDFKSSLGNPITAEDVALSFRRLLVRNTNTHGRISLFICAPAKNLESATKECRGISVNGNEVEFEMNPGVSPGFFISLLASTDFSVIPKGVLDLSQPDAPIMNYQETSGYYSVEHDDPENFRHEFALNPFHPLRAKDMVQKVVTEPIYGAEAVAAVWEDKIDFIPTSTYTSAVDVNQLKERMGDGVQIHASLPIQLHALMFTERGFKELSERQRIVLGAKLKRNYITSFAQDALQGTDQVYPSLGEGELLPAQATEIREMFEQAANQDLPPGNYEVSAAPDEESLFREVFGKEAAQGGAVRIRVMTQAPWLLPYDQQPHAFVGTLDSAFYEDISMVSYGLQQGFLQTSIPDTWIKTYISLEAKAERMEMLRSLHFESLKKGRVIPLGVASYRAIARRPWRMDFPRYFAGSSLWMLRVR